MKSRFGICRVLRHYPGGRSSIIVSAMMLFCVPLFGQVPAYPVGGLQSGGYASGGDEQSLVSISMEKGWNMVSLSYDVPDAAIRTLFPGVTSHAFAWVTAYQIRDTLRPGLGYWLKIDAGRTVAFVASPLQSESIRVAAGWNMIGAISTPRAVSSLTSDPPGMSVSKLFGYRSKYITADTLYPGRGYWIRAGSEGTLSLSSADPAGKEHLLKRVVIAAEREMPPAPPGDAGTLSGTLPDRFALEPNTPNPFNPSTLIRYALPSGSHVEISITDVLGRHVATIVNEEETPGYKSIEWNAAGMASGVYFYRIETRPIGGGPRSFTSTRKMLLLR